MKILLIVCGLIVMTACVKDSLEQTSPQARILGTPAPEIALQGALSVKLTPEMAQSVAVAQAQLASTRADGSKTRSGVGEIDALLEEIGADRFQRIVAYDPAWESIYDQTGMNRWYRIAFDKDTDLSEVGRRFAAVPGIAIVEYEIQPRHIRPMHVGPAVPAHLARLPQNGGTRATVYMNDPLLDYQWHYENFGPNQDFSTPRPGADINLQDAWNLCTGNEDIVVAVLDEPVQTTHPDLMANIWSNPENAEEHGYNFWDNKAELDWQTAAQDETGQWVYADHGTHVAGIIAAVNNNSRGVCGIAGGRSGKGGVKIMSCQIMGYSRGDETHNPIVRAFEYAWTHGAVIAQNSWGYDFGTATSAEIAREWKNNYGVIRDAIDTFIAGAGTQNPASPLQGGLVFFAAGNDGDLIGDDPTYPASYAPVIAVGSMDWAYRPAYYTDYGTWVDITAPGGDVYTSRIDGTLYADGQVLSTILCDNTMTFRDGRRQSALYGYGFMQGTSMACPHVSGVAALGLSYAAQLGRKYTADEFKALLLSSVYGIDSYFTGTKEGITVSDLSAYQGKMGSGCVDALKLLLAIRGTPAVYIPVGESVTVDFARFFGGNQSKVALEAAKLETPGNLGIVAASLQIDGTSIAFQSTQPGVSMLQITAKAGDTEFVREFAVVARAGLADNGGWL